MISKLGQPNQQFSGVYEIPNQNCNRVGFIPQAVLL